MAKSWREKLATSHDLPKVVPIPERMAWTHGPGTMLVPAPSEVDAVMRRVQPRRLATVGQISQSLAKEHRADVGCNVTTGIFAWVAANAADEDEMDGETAITPYWRVLKNTWEINPKYPGGVDRAKERLQSEGHVLVLKGKRLAVDADESRIAVL
jgi:hypothetical protein